MNTFIIIALSVGIILSYLISLAFKKYVAEATKPICKSKDGNFHSHCFHSKGIKDELCNEGGIEVKRKCCRCGCIKEMPRHY